MSQSHENLNPEQRRAVEYIGGPLLVVAGPGTGKTRVITHRVAHRIALGTPAERILGITFTNRAASEMRSRISALVGDDAPARLGTFHWMCNSLLRRHADRIGHSRNFRLLTPSEARDALKRAVAETWPGELHAVGRIASAVSASKNGALAEEIARRYGLAAEAVDAVRQTYSRTLGNARALDLDDLLDVSVKLLREDQRTRELCRSWYADIVVDEFQDTNPVQQELLRLLVPADGSIVAVGDEDQAIYGWRQADSHAMHRFLEDFPGAELVQLTETYRSSKRILRASGTLIAHNPGRLGSELRTPNPAGDLPVLLATDDERDEAEVIAAEVQRLTGRHEVKPSEIAILYRVNAQSRALEDALARRGIPYHIHAGARFYQRPEVRRVTAYLRLVLSDDDDDAAAQLASDVRGVGERRLEQLRTSAGTREIPLLRRLAEPVSGLSPGSLASLRAIPDRVQILRERRRDPLSALVSAAIDASREGVDYAAQPDAESIQENLDELRSIVKELGGRTTTLRQLVDRLSMAGSESPRGGVALMTLHAAKGLEFEVVFVTGVEEGLLPHRRSQGPAVDLDEERRLLYVGMTRARSHLYLSHAHGRLLGGHFSLAEGSRFLREIGALNLELRASARRQARPRLTSVDEGESVIHPRWGAGRVIRVEGTGRETLVTIDFGELGQRRLQLCHAPLMRPSSELPDVLAG